MRANSVFPRRIFYFLPGAMPRGLAGPRPSRTHYRRLPGRTRRLRGLQSPAMRLQQLRRPPHPSRGQPCFIYSMGPGATRKAARGFRSHGFQPGRHKAGEEKRPRALRPGPGTAGLGLRPEALTFNTKSVR